MLFRAQFHDGIRRGRITAAIRAWQSPRVKVGGRYGVGRIGLIEVDAIERVALRDVRDRDARAAGFASRDELVAELVRSSRGPVTARTKLFRVRFHYAGRDTRKRPETDARLGAGALDELVARLDAMDRRSAHGPWTQATLAEIARRPGTAAAKLAESLGRERPPFKADVRKLKRLGLTESLEVGYRITPRGRAVLRARGTR